MGTPVGERFPVHPRSEALGPTRSEDFPPLRRGPVNSRGAKLWSACSSLPLSPPQACLRPFLPASSLAGISTPTSVCIRIPSRQSRVPASSHGAEPVHPYDQAPSIPAERSFGVCAACCRFPFRKLACGNLHRHLGLYSHSFPAIASPSQRAGWGKSGSKLHTLQSFAPYAIRDTYSKASHV